MDNYGNIRGSSYPNRPLRAMKPSLTRRDFLKLTGLLSASAVIPVYSLKPGPVGKKTNQQNVLIIIFDAWSASNTSLYGYGRKTTPNLEQLAEKAIVYHNHLSCGNFTTPGTASLLTGALPWSHRAFILNDTVHKSFARKSIFHAFESYHRLAYTHNPIANTLLRQFMKGIDQYIPMKDLYLDSDILIDTFFSGDDDIAVVGMNRALKKDEGYSYSLYLSKYYDEYKREQVDKFAQVAANYPLGVPNYDGVSYFTLEDGIDGVMDIIQGTAGPYFGYFHFLPPHNPYKSRVDFYNKFSNDHFDPPHKPEHFFTENSTPDRMMQKRLLYDEFILYVDHEFSRLYTQMESSGLLENTWLILTSDHGEMFERGILGHMTPSLHKPVVHVPLVVFPPGEQKRVDVYEPTSAIDLLPTLMHLTGQDIPDWAEGVVLPPFAAASSNSDREIFALQVGDTGRNGKITSATLMMIQDRYKLIWYFGYEELKDLGDLIEVYDIIEDPEEYHNLVPSHQDLANKLLGIARSKLAEMNEV